MTESNNTPEPTAGACGALLQDETARACVTVLVALLPLPTRSRTRVLAFVADQLHEDAAPAEERHAGAVGR